MKGNTKVTTNRQKEAKTMDRRGFIKLAALGGGIVFASSLKLDAFGAISETRATAAAHEDFYFVQLSDTHWGFEGPKINPDAQGTLKKAIEAVNELEQKPDFIVFTGRLTHTTNDPKLRRERKKQFQEIGRGLKIKDVRFMAGEHDASLDRGEAYQELFGKLNY